MTEEKHKVLDKPEIWHDYDGERLLRRRAAWLLKDLRMDIGVGLPAPRIDPSQSTLWWIDPPRSTLMVDRSASIRPVPLTMIKV